MTDLRTLKELVRQLIYVMTKRQRIHSIFLFVIIFIGSFFAMLGVSAILPFIQALMSPNELFDNPFLIPVLHFFGIKDTYGLIIFVSTGVILLYIIKNLYLVFAASIRVRFRSSLYNELSIRLLHSYMKRPYTFFLDANSAKIISGIGFDSAGARIILDCVLDFLQCALGALLIGCLIVYTDPVMALGVLSLAFICFVGVTLGFKKKMKVMGISFREAELNRSKYALQAITGIKEVMVMQRRDYFVDSFRRAARKSQKADIASGTITAIPDRLIEAICVAGMIGIICVRIAIGIDVVNFIPRLAVFAVAAFNILPNVSKMVSCITEAIFHRTRLEAAYNCLRDADEYAKTMSEYIQIRRSDEVDLDHEVKFEKQLEIGDICWKYSKVADNVLEGASLTVNKGESIALIGASGAGKTTMADIILGLLRPQSGIVEVDGIDIFAIPKHWSRIVGYVPQSVFMIDDTVKANVSFGIREEEVEDELVWQALEQAQLKSFVESLPEGINTIIGDRGIKFSGGQRQRLAIARTLYYNPDILVLDEATSALDDETETAVMEAIDALSKHKTLIIVAHRLTTIKNCDKIYEIADGKALLRSKRDIFGE